MQRGAEVCGECNPIMAALAETSGPPGPRPPTRGAALATNAAATGAPATETANTTASPPPAGPSGVTSPSTTAPGPARPPAPPPAAARPGAPRAPRGGHLETGPSADTLRLLRQGELSERRPLPLRPRESGRCTGRVQAERQRGSTRFSAETAVRRRHLPLLRARAVSERRELPVFPRRDEGVGTSPSLVRRNLITVKTVRNGRTTGCALDVECVATGQDP